MHPVARLLGIAVVFALACLAWMGLSGLTHSRTTDQTRGLEGAVSELWGSAQTQAAPRLQFSWVTTEQQRQLEEVNGTTRAVTKAVDTRHEERVAPASSAITVDLDRDLRRKGLVWYPLYDVDFDGAWTYRHDEPVAGTLHILFDFPDQQGMYDGFRLVVDGQDRAAELRPDQGTVVASIPVSPGQEVAFAAGYRSRGMTEWRYQPAQGVASLEDFALTLTTDFADIDFPVGTMSPSERARDGDGWTLSWAFDRVVTGHGLGMVVPHPVQPGELATELSLSAPVSLLFFFVVLFVLSVLKGIELHPLNYLLLAGAFFAFHLLFAYSADRLPVEWAFGVSSVVSVVLVVSYLRLVVGPRFAFVEAGLAQLVYLVGFSLAHFWDGFTGLTVTILSILTLFLVMQWTGRVQWGEVLSRSRQPDPEPA